MAVYEHQFMLMVMKTFAEADCHSDLLWQDEMQPGVSALFDACGPERDRAMEG